MDLDQQSMDAATQLADTWGSQFLTSLQPAAKRPRAGQADAHPEVGPGQGTRCQQGWREAPRSRNDEEELIKMTARLSLQHEDFGHDPGQQRFYFGSGSLNLIPALVELSGQWKSQVA